MAVFTRSTVGFGFLGFALVTGCAGRASSPGLDGNAGGSLASDGGNGGDGALPNASGAVAGALAGALSSGAGGAPGSAGQSSSGAGAGGAARAGSPSTAGNNAGGAGAGASASAGAGADAGAGAGSTLSEVTAACTGLCSWIHGCSIWEFGPTCKSNCASDLAVQNGACTDLGLAMLSCMTATDGTTNNALCDGVFRGGIAACRAKVDAFRTCAAGSGGSAPLLKICMRAGDSFLGGGCAENKVCLDEKYFELECADAPGGQSSCTCTAKSSSTEFTFHEPSDKACLNHIAECVASANSAP